MGQVTLNLIAITVFLTTMAVLLGPLVHLAPEVPAIAIATVLGLAIVDQLSWQGTLGNLVIGSLSRLAPEQRQRVIHHEAGHFLVAHLLGIPVTDYSLTAWDAWRKGFPGQGGVQFDTAALEGPLATGHLPAQLLNRYCTVWMAGIAAEQLTYHDALGGQDDCQKLAGCGSSSVVVNKRPAPNSAGLHSRPVPCSNSTPPLTQLSCKPWKRVKRSRTVRHCYSTTVLPPI
jgi:hypothetical protein